LKFKKEILIVGGTGFIGYHLAKKSLAKGMSVTSISTNKPKAIRYLPKVKYLICDITKKEKLKKCIRKNFQYVVNLGGYVDHSKKIKTFNSHFLGCKNLTEIFINKKPKTFVQMGSSIEYGRSLSPHKESFKCYPKSVYGKAKLLSSKYLIKLYKKKNFPSVVLRLYQAYGPRQDRNRFLPIIISGCLKNKSFPCSEGIQSRDFIHVEDVVNAILKSLVSKKALGNIINIGSGKPRKIKNIINHVRQYVKGGKPLFGKVKLRKDEILKVYPNIKKANKKLKWKPKISFKKGLQATIKFYNEQLK